MTLKRNVLCGLAAGTLLISQSVAAAPLPARATAAVGDSEELAGVPSAAAPAVFGILTLLVIFGIMALTGDDDDDDGFPASP